MDVQHHDHSFEIRTAPPIPTVQVFDGDSLFCPEAILGWEIQWLDANKSAILGETNAWFIAPTTGIYFARLKLGTSCFPTSSGTNVVSTEEYNLSKIKVTPNPTSSIIQIFSSGGIYTSYRLRLTNLSGQIFYEEIKKASGNLDTEKINMTPFPPGVYIIERIDSKKIESERVVKF